MRNARKRQKQIMWNTWNTGCFRRLKKLLKPSKTQHYHRFTVERMVHRRFQEKKKKQVVFSHTGIVWKYNGLCVSLVSTGEFATELLQTMKIFTFVILAWWSLIRFLLTSRSCEIKITRSLSLARYTRFFHCNGTPCMPFGARARTDRAPKILAVRLFRLSQLQQGVCYIGRFTFTSGIRYFWSWSLSVNDWQDSFYQACGMGCSLFLVSFLPFLEIWVLLPVFVPVYWR